MDTASVVESSVRAWHQRDEAARGRLLEESWAEDGVYTDPSSTIEGREALVKAIADFHAASSTTRAAWSHITAIAA